MKFLQMSKEYRFEYKNDYIDSLNAYINSHFPEFLQLFLQISVKIILILVISIILDFLLKRIMLPTINFFIKRFKLKSLEIAFKNKFFHSLIHFISLFIAYILVPYIFYNHPFFFQYVNKIFFVAVMIVFYYAFFRLLAVIEEIALDDKEYKSVALRSFSQLFKIFSIVIGFFIVLFLFFNINATQIITVIGAITAFVLLIFKDAILGFVAGVQVSTSKTLKRGDWISIPKYEIEGHIKEINLVTVKVLNFDKTISSIPTYDLISTEVKNLETLMVENRRRIKRVIYFNIKSFKFVEGEALEKYRSHSLIKNYIDSVLEQMKIEKKENNLTSTKFTNIGIFRKYTELFLKEHPQIDQEDLVLVRQLEVTPNGLPLELYCFAKTSDLYDFEEIQSNLFDHLLTLAKSFDLEVLQTPIR